MLSESSFKRAVCTFFCLVFAIAAVAAAAAQDVAAETPNKQGICDDEASAVTDAGISCTDSSRETPVACECWAAPKGRRCVLALWDNPPEQGGCNVYLRVRGKTDLTLIYPAARSVRVVWSPHARNFAINDHDASNASNCLVFSARGLDMRADVAHILKSFPDDKYAEVPGYDKCYINATGWKNENTIAIKADGWRYDEDRKLTIGFCFHAELNVRKQRLTIIKPIAYEETPWSP